MRLCRFGLTGLVGTCVHVIVAVALIRSGTAAYLANTTAFIVATVVSYVINTRWSFSSELGRRTLHRYVTVATFGCLLTMVVSGAAQMAALDYRIGILLVIALVTPITFMLHSRWTYRTPHDSRLGD